MRQKAIARSMYEALVRVPVRVFGLFVVAKRLLSGPITAIVAPDARLTNAN